MRRLRAAWWLVVLCVSIVSAQLTPGRMEPGRAEPGRSEPQILVQPAGAGATTTTETPTTTTTTLDYPADWTNATGIKAVWLFETTSYGTNSSTNCDTSCNLPNNGTPTQDGTNKMQGSYAMGITIAATAGVDDNAGGDADLHFTGDAGFGCWIRPTVTVGNTTYLFTTTDTFNEGIGARTNFAGNWQGYSANQSCTVANPPALDTWQYVYTTHDDTSTAIFHGLSGASTNRTCTTANATAANSGGYFFIGWNQGGASGWTGQVDECVLANAALTEAAWCHICSCGINGQSGGCTCNGTSYANEGRNDSNCGGCTLLSDCNAAAPPVR